MQSNKIPIIGVSEEHLSLSKHLAIGILSHCQATRSLLDRQCTNKQVKQKQQKCLDADVEDAEVVVVEEEAEDLRAQAAEHSAVVLVVLVDEVLVDVAVVLVVLVLAALDEVLVAVVLVVVEEVLVVAEEVAEEAEVVVVDAEGRWVVWVAVEGFASCVAGRRTCRQRILPARGILRSCTLLLLRNSIPI